MPSAWCSTGPLLAPKERLRKLIEQIGHPMEKLRDTLAGDRRDCQGIPAELSHDPLARFSCARDIQLRDHQELRPIREIGTVAFELLSNRPVVHHRVGTIRRDGVDQMDEQPRALDVPEEFVAEAMALVGAPRSGLGCRQPRTRGRDRRGRCPGWDTWS